MDDVPVVFEVISSPLESTAAVTEVEPELIALTRSAAVVVSEMVTEAPAMEKVEPELRPRQVARVLDVMELPAAVQVIERLAEVVP